MILAAIAIASSLAATPVCIEAKNARLSHIVRLALAERVDRTIVVDAEIDRRYTMQVCDERSAEWALSDFLRA